MLRGTGFLKGFPPPSALRPAYQFSVEHSLYHVDIENVARRRVPRRENTRFLHRIPDPVIETKPDFLKKYSHRASVFQIRVIESSVLPSRLKLLEKS